VSAVSSSSWQLATSVLSAVLLASRRSRSRAATATPPSTRVARGTARMPLPPSTLQGSRISPSTARRPLRRVSAKAVQLRRPLSSWLKSCCATGPPRPATTGGSRASPNSSTPPASLLPRLARWRLRRRRAPVRGTSLRGLLLLLLEATLPFARRTALPPPPTTLLPHAKMARAAKSSRTRKSSSALLRMLAWVSSAVASAKLVPSKRPPLRGASASPRVLLRTAGAALRS